MTDRQSEAYEADREDEAREREQIRRERFGVLPPRDATKRADVLQDAPDLAARVETLERALRDIVAVCQNVTEREPEKSIRSSSHPRRPPLWVGAYDRFIDPIESED